MRDDALDQLRRENPVTDEVPTVPLETLLRWIEQEPTAAPSAAAAGQPWRRRAGRLILPALAGLAAIAIAVLALTTFHHRTPRSGPSSTAAIPGRQQLIDTLAVLRRPQTKADLNPQFLRLLSRLGRGLLSVRQGTPDMSLVRLATTTPWGEKVFLVPLKPPTAAQLRAAARRFPGRTERRFLLSRWHDQETLAVYTLVPGGSGGGTCCLTAANIASLNGGAGTEGMSSLHGGDSYTRLFEVVPDQVAKIVYILPRQGNRIGPGTPTYKHTATVTGEAHGNVVVAQVARQCCTGRIASTWYGTNGQILKRVGSAAAANRIVHVPKPGPQTTLSRDAERDPSTPNRVWISPATGGRHTQFRIHFQVLLTDASYHYTFTGTHCAALPYSTGGIGGGFDDIRGRVWSDPLSPGAGQSLCPGTYQVSVTVRSLGPGRMPLRPPPRPFGSATFTVRP